MMQPPPHHLSMTITYWQGRRKGLALRIVWLAGMARWCMTLCRMAMA